jgi:hypothetical protein
VVTILNVTDVNGCIHQLSRVITVATNDTQAPTPPNFTGKSRCNHHNHTNLYSDWDASTDNVGATGYEISRSANGGTSCT